MWRSDTKCKYMFMFPLKNLARKELRVPMKGSCRLWVSAPGVLYDIGYPSETHLKLKSRELSWIHITCCSCPIVWKFCSEHDSVTVVPCTKLQNVLETTKLVMDKQVLARFELKMRFRRISYIAQGLSPQQNTTQRTLCTYFRAYTYFAKIPNQASLWTMLRLIPMQFG